MATPITHLFFADKFCDKHPEIERFPFFVWNCLPDIRYIDKDISRTKFHAKNISIDNVFGEKLDFWKGVKFHSFVDENRDYFYEKHWIYKPGVSDWVFILSLKVFEDDILYSHISFRQDFIKFFLEYQFPVEDINDASIRKWKEILCDYFSSQPSKLSRRKFILWVWLSENLAEQIEGMLVELNKKYTEDINDMVKFLENLM